MTSAFIPISVIRLGTAEEELVLEVLRSGHLVQGPKVEQFEKLFATMCDARHAIAVNSGTTALAVTLEALDIGPGDEVLTSPLTFAATLNAILETGEGWWSPSPDRGKRWRPESRPRRTCRS